MSKTEQDALEAGNVWWEGELFSGMPDWRKLNRLPPPKLTEEEQAFLDGPVEQLCRLLDDWEITHELADMPQHVWEFIKRERFFAMIIPKEYGGLGFSPLANSMVLAKISSRNGTASSTIGVPNSLGPAELLLHYGTEEQKQRWLPGLASGEEIPCFALTSPRAGSDATAIVDTGVVCKGKVDGQEVVGIRLNWEKRYITLAPIATVLGLAFKLYDPDHLLGDRDEYGITAALIPTNLPGVEIGRRHFPDQHPVSERPDARPRRVRAARRDHRRAEDGWTRLAHARAAAVGRPQHRAAEQCARRRDGRRLRVGCLCAHSPPVQSADRQVSWRRRGARAHGRQRLHHDGGVARDLHRVGRTARSRPCLRPS